MTAALGQVTEVPLPSHTRIGHLYPKIQLADAYTVPLPAGANTDPETLARFVFGQQAPWVGQLMKLRDALVAGFGIKTSTQLETDRGPRGDLPASSRVGLFRIYERHPDEIVLGEDDKHLDFRVSLLVRPAPAGSAAPRELVASTVVSCHNLLGRSYLGLIRPFHRQVVKSALRRAAAAGWPPA